MKKIKEMKYWDLTNKQLIELLKLRLDNDDKREKFSIIPTKIRIGSKTRDIKVNYFAVHFIVSSDKWADENECIVFNRFYPNEFLYLQKCGIKF